MTQLTKEKDIDALLQKIVTTNNSHQTFIIMENTVGQQWILPTDNLKLALNLYQPSRMKGKLIKKLLPIFIYIPFIIRFLRLQETRLDLRPEIYIWLCDIFHCDRIEFAIFCGTPCSNQKITIQLSKGKEILGYCKVSDRLHVIQLFEKESRMLDYLQSKGNTQSPHSLFCGIFKDNLNMFVQTTKKTIHSKYPYRHKSLVSDFLIKLNRGTSEDIKFEDSDYFETIHNLENQLQSFKKDSINNVFEVIQEIYKKYSGQTVSFSFYHGDFTPWNCFVEDNELFVFDFEYCKKTYPPFLDYFHYFTQHHIYDKRSNAESIYKAYLIERHGLLSYIKNPDLVYKMYLLEIINLYLKIEIRNGLNNEDIYHKFRVWFILLELLHSNS